MYPRQSYSKPQSAKNSLKNAKQELLAWICEKHATNGPLSCDIFREKVLQLKEDYGLKGFKCTQHWMTKFLKSYGFSPTLTSCDGPVFDDYHDWIKLLRKLITHYKHRDFFTVDQLTMLPNVQPRNVVSLTEIKDLKSEPEKITILLCCNASGNEKLPLLISGPYESEDAEQTNDFVYCYNKNSEISDEVFVNWLARFNERLVLDDRKVLLLTHRSRIRASGNSRLSNIKFLFFPKKFPTKLCPLQREIFHYLKIIYRQEYAKEIKKEQPRWSLDHIKRTLLNCWRNTSREMIISSFQKTTFRDDNSFLEFSNPDFWHALEPGITFRKFVTFDDKLSSESINQRHTSLDYNLRSGKRKLVSDYSDSPNKRRRTSRNVSSSKAYEMLDKKDGKGDSDSDCIIIDPVEDITSDSVDTIILRKSENIQNSDFVPENGPSNSTSDDRIKIVKAENIASLGYDQSIGANEPHLSKMVETYQNLTQDFSDSSVAQEPLQKPGPSVPNIRIVSDEILTDKSLLFLSFFRRINVREEIDQPAIMQNSGEMVQGQSQESNEPRQSLSNPGQLTGVHLEEIFENPGSESVKSDSEEQDSPKTENWAQKYENEYVFGSNEQRNSLPKTSNESSSI